MRLIVDIIRRNSIGSQNELLARLREQGLSVTQATLSRDLKALKIIKVTNDMGSYMYILPESTDTAAGSMATGHHVNAALQDGGALSVDFSGHMVVVKTLNGYATGLAYDIDLSNVPEILGTIAGADTLFVLMREDVPREEALDIVCHFIFPN